MPVKLTNNATSLLAGNITAAATTISVTASDAGKFPTTATGDWFPVTVVDSSGNMEIMKATARNGAIITVARGQEGTTARAFSAGARIDLRITAAVLNELFSEFSNFDNTYLKQAGGTITGGLSVKGNLASDGIIAGRMKHVNNYFEIHSYSSGYGIGYAQLWWNATANELTIAGRDETNSPKDATLKISKVTSLHAPANRTDAANRAYVDDNFIGYVRDLGTSENLDNITETGIYHQARSASAGSGSNYPLNQAGLLEVHAKSTMVYQRYSVFNTGEVYSRSCYMNAWSAWLHQASRAYVDSNKGAETAYRAFTASGTWTKPSGISPDALVRVECWGAGGGGGDRKRGGGGGGGAYATRTFRASQLTATVSVSVGAGGEMATNGGNSSFGSYLSANGGMAGASSPAGAGGAGGTSNINDWSGGAGGAGGTGSGTAPAGQNRQYGGGGGGGGSDNSNNDGTGGVSVEGGNGGGGATNKTGQIPGGGGASSNAGARGEVRIHVIG